MQRINFIMKLHVSGIYETLVKWFLVWVTLKKMLGDGLMVLKGVHGEYGFGQRKDCWSYAM